MCFSFVDFSNFFFNCIIDLFVFVVVTLRLYKLCMLIVLSFDVFNFNVK